MSIPSWSPRCDSSEKARRDAGPTLTFAEDEPSRSPTDGSRLTADDRTLTVAKLRRRDDADYVEVLFPESARIYKLLKEQRRFDELLQPLQVAERDRRRVKLRLASPRSDVIEDVHLP